MVGKGIEAFTVLCLISGFHEATEGHNESLMNQCEWRTESRRQHLLQLSDNHLFIDLEAVTHDLIFIVLLISDEAAYDIYITIHHLK